ncbi:UNVERIFIED_ORG: hypothetical protein ABIB52_004589 [Arthrobacter sp. UYCu721]
MTVKKVAAFTPYYSEDQAGHWHLMTRSGVLGLEETIREYLGLEDQCSGKSR